jgi:hypothetical protein
MQGLSSLLIKIYFNEPDFPSFQLSPDLWVLGIFPHFPEVMGALWYAELQGVAQGRLLQPCPKLKLLGHSELDFLSRFEECNLVYQIIFKGIYLTSY